MKAFNKKLILFWLFDPINKDHCRTNCPKRKSCNICNKNHPTGLHIYKPKSKELGTRSNNNTATDDGGKSSVQIQFTRYTFAMFLRMFLKRIRDVS